MYVVHGANDQSRPRVIRGLAQVRDTSDRPKSLDAILRALQLNPVGGYVKGSPARRQLQEAIDSVPLISAFEIYNQLGNGVGLLGRLFQLRLHTATRNALRAILWNKHLAQKRQLEEAQLILKQACQDAQKGIARQRTALTAFESAGEKVCRLDGEDSEQCQKYRFALLEMRTKLDDQVRSTGSKCP